MPVPFQSSGQGGRVALTDLTGSSRDPSRLPSRKIPISLIQGRQANCVARYTATFGLMNRRWNGSRTARRILYWDAVFHCPQFTPKSKTVGNHCPRPNMGAKYRPYRTASYRRFHIGAQTCIPYLSLELAGACRGTNGQRAQPCQGVARVVVS